MEKLLDSFTPYDIQLLNNYYNCNNTLSIYVSYGF